MDPVYLDYAATTPLRDEVVTAMEPYASEVFANPSSLHAAGRKAHAALERAREEVADAIGARPSEIRFVRGGTESDNLAVLGSCRAKRRATGRTTPLLVSAVEHSAVLEAAQRAEADGDASLSLLDVSPEGAVDLEAIRMAGASTDGQRDSSAPERATGTGGEDGVPTPTVSVMWANNETGMLLPVGEIVEAAAVSGATVHTDASQALGKVPVDVDETRVDLLTATGHKIYGPRGMGILFVREGTELDPLHFGGGQERGLRPGTEDVAGAVGLATAVRLAVAEREAAASQMGTLRERLEARLLGEIEGLRVNCAAAPRAPHVSSVGIPGVSDGRSLLMALDLEGIAVSGGSACHSGAGRGSHVIAALYGADDPMTTVRYSLGRASTEGDVDRAVAATVAVVRRLRGGTEDAA